MKSKQFLMLGVVLAGTALAQQTQPAPQRVQRTEAIAMGNLIEVVTPQYPDEARQQHSTGKVVLQILIDNEGKVKDASVLTGDALLSNAALTAVKQWKFRPYLLKDEHVEVETTATVEYTADPPFVITPKPFQGPRKVRVSQGVLEKSIVRRVEPQYPSEAKANHIQGDVLIDATIDTKGNIARLNVIKGDPVLAKAAVEAVRQWKYTPYSIQGDPVEVETTILVRFFVR
jgi:TonB family protein